MTQLGLIPDVEPKNEIDHRHLEAQRVFEAVLSDLPYGDRYSALMGQGWEWRKAAYIMWLSIPKDEREPKTKKEFAKTLGLVDGAVFSGWEAKNPAIAAEAFRFSQANLLGNIASVDKALTEVASKASYKSAPAMRLFYERAGVLANANKVNVLIDNSTGAGQLGEMSNAELLAELAEIEKLEAPEKITPSENVLADDFDAVLDAFGGEE